MSWASRPLCLRCQRAIHGPGTGPLGPDGAWAYKTQAPQCALCGRLASPPGYLRLWTDEDEEEEAR